MRIVLFYDSLISDWNQGNAPFLRGVVTELIARRHDVSVYEPRETASLQRLVADHGLAPLAWFQQAYPGLESIPFDPAGPELEAALDGADLVIVHESNEPQLVGRIGGHRARNGGYRLLFHDAHHRAVTAPHELEGVDLQHYDGVLAGGDIIRDRYLERGWVQRAWTWRAGADLRVFRPHPELKRQRDLVWVGNWGDDERAARLHEFLVDPVRELELTATVHGSRYPELAREQLQLAGIEYRGWLPNFRAPEAYAQHRMTVHVPRRPWVDALPGIPSTRMFEALASGIALISAPWDDADRLFTAGQDYLVARDGAEMKQHMRTLLAEPEHAAALADRGRRTVAQRHTCAHRVSELLAIACELGVGRWERMLAS